MERGGMYQLSMQTPSSPLAVRFVSLPTIVESLASLFHRFGVNDSLVRPGYLLTREHDVIVSCGMLRNGTTWSTSVTLPLVLVRELGVAHCKSQAARQQNQVRIHLPFGAVVERQLYTEFGRLETAVDFCVPPELGRYLSAVFSDDTLSTNRGILLERACGRLVDFIERTHGKDSQSTERYLLH